MTLFAGGRQMPPREAVVFARVLEILQILPFPGGRVHHLEVQAVVVGMAFRALRLFLLRQIGMISSTLGELGLDFGVALEAGPGESLLGVALLAVGDDPGACHSLVAPGKISRGGTIERNVGHHSDDEQTSDNEGGSVPKHQSRWKKAFKESTK
jgi:hypothetical protein